MGKIAGALSSLAAADTSLSGMCGKCVPGLVAMLESADPEGREEAAGALKFFSIVSFNMKVSIVFFSTESFNMKVGPCWHTAGPE